MYRMSFPGLQPRKRLYPYTLFHGFFQRLAGSELHDAGSGDEAFLTGAGVTALAFAAFDDLEATEASEGNLRRGTVRLRPWCRGQPWRGFCRQDLLWS